MIEATFRVPRGVLFAEPFAHEDGGLGVVVEAGDFFVASAAVHGDGGLELGFGVEVDPGVAGMCWFRDGLMRADCPSAANAALISAAYCHG